MIRYSAHEQRGLSMQEKNNKGSGNAKPLSLYPLTPEEALRRAMQAQPPKEERKKKSVKGNKKEQ